MQGQTGCPANIKVQKTCLRKTKEIGTIPTCCFNASFPFVSSTSLRWIWPKAEMPWVFLFGCVHFEPAGRPFRAKA